MADGPRLYLGQQSWAIGSHSRLSDLPRGFSDRLLEPPRCIWFSTWLWKVTRYLLASSQVRLMLLKISISNCLNCRPWPHVGEVMQPSPQSWNICQQCKVLADTRPGMTAESHVLKPEASLVAPAALLCFCCASQVFWRDRNIML